MQEVADLIRSLPDWVGPFLIALAVATAVLLILFIIALRHSVNELRQWQLRDTSKGLSLALVISSLPKWFLCPLFLWLMCAGVLTGFVAMHIAIEDREETASARIDTLGTVPQGIQKDSTLIGSISTVYAANVEDFISSLANNRRIVLSDGSYDLTAFVLQKGLERNSELDTSDREEVFSAARATLADFDHVRFDSGLVLENLHNVIIEGAQNTWMVTRFGATDVLRFHNCSNIRFKNMKMRHEDAWCWDPVLTILDCNNIVVENCLLKGSGAIGLRGERIRNLVFQRNLIEDCWWESTILDELYGTNTIEGNICGNNGGGVHISNGDVLYFIDNRIYHNGWGSYGYGNLVRITCAVAYFEGNKITDNRSEKGVFVYAEEGTFRNNDIHGNIIED